MSSKNILVGVCGGIAAYKTCELVRFLIKEGHNVQVMMTKGAQNFITALTFEALSQNRVATDLFSASPNSEIDHIKLADNKDLVIVAPATANMMAKMTYGLCDDIVSTALLATKAPILIAPAMNVNMWEHESTQSNLKTLKGRGVHVIEPTEGELACGWSGKGRLAEPSDILTAAKKFI